MSDLFDRTLRALQLLQAPQTDPVSLAAWEEVRDGLLVMRREQEAAQAALQAAQALISALSAYEAELDTDDPGRLVQLAGACTAAESALAEALARMPAEAEAALSPGRRSGH